MPAATYEGLLSFAADVRPLWLNARQPYAGAQRMPPNLEPAAQ